MGRDNGAPFQRGNTGYGPGATIDSGNLKFAELLGQVKEFEDEKWGDYGAKGTNSMFQVTCMVVRNTSGGALLPSQTVVIDSNFNATGVSAVSEGPFAVVDEFLPAAGVVANDVFYVVIHGPAQVITTPGNSSNAADQSIFVADGTATGTLVPYAPSAVADVAKAGRNYAWAMGSVAKSAGTVVGRLFVKTWFDS